jgi:hypothetical protein
MMSIDLHHFARCPLTLALPLLIFDDADAMSLPAARPLLPSVFALRDVAY